MENPILVSRSRIWVLPYPIPPRSAAQILPIAAAGPFALQELLARVAALGRRPRQTVPVTVLRVDDLEMDLLARVVRRGGQSIELQPREFRLLEYLLQHPEQVVTRAMLLEKVWDLHFDPHTNVVETHVSRLRAKIDRGHATTLIHTIRGSGYCLRAPA